MVLPRFAPHLAHHQRHPHQRNATPTKPPRRIMGVTTKERIRALYDPETQTYAPEALLMAKAIGNAVAKMHDADIVHGDLTTSNMMLRAPEFHESAGVVMIDFGLGFQSNLHEGPNLAAALF